MDSDFPDPFEFDETPSDSLFAGGPSRKSSSHEKPRKGGRMRKLDPWSKRYWSHLGFAVIPVTSTKTWFDRESGAMMNVASDFLGVADLMALRSGDPAVLIQVCATTNRAAHLRTIRDGKSTRLWLATGNRLVLDCWSKNKAGRFELSQTEITPELLDKLDARRRP